jgi:hypothetical protein
MDTLLSVIVLLSLAAPVGLAAAWFSSRGAEAMSSLFKTDRGLGWPRGVQEEDPVAWNWEHGPAVAPPPPGSEPARSPIVERVAFRIGRGSARGGRGGPHPR